MIVRKRMEMKIRRLRRLQRTAGDVNTKKRKINED